MSRFDLGIDVRQMIHPLAQLVTWTLLISSDVIKYETQYFFWNQLTQLARMTSIHCTIADCVSVASQWFGKSKIIIGVGRNINLRQQA